jgi:hypothetical protein
MILNRQSLKHYNIFQPYPFYSPHILLRNIGPSGPRLRACTVFLKINEKEISLFGVHVLLKRGKVGIFSLRHCVRTGSGAHLQTPTQWVPRALTPWVKRPGREADHSPPSSVEVKNVWSYTYTSPYVFMAWCLVKRRNSFTFTCTLVLYYFAYLTSLNVPLLQIQIVLQS